MKKDVVLLNSGEYREHILSCHIYIFSKDKTYLYSWYCCANRKDSIKYKISPFQVVMIFPCKGCPISFLSNLLIFNVFIFLNTSWKKPYIYAKENEIWYLLLNQFLHQIWVTPAMGSYILSGFQTCSSRERIKNAQKGQFYYL